jgi:hypothetical protein
MTKKDYELIAWALSNAYMDEPPVDGRVSYAAIVRRMANALEQGNPRFNKTIFYDACGVSKDTVEV